MSPSFHSLQQNSFIVSEIHFFLSLPLINLLKLFFLDTVSDTPKDDLLSHVEECSDFINDALSNKKVILVHW